MRIKLTCSSHDADIMVVDIVLQLPQHLLSSQATTVLQTLPTFMVLEIMVWEYGDSTFLFCKRIVISISIKEQWKQDVTKWGREDVFNIQCRVAILRHVAILLKLQQEKSLAWCYLG